MMLSKNVHFVEFEVNPDLSKPMQIGTVTVEVNDIALKMDRENVMRHANKVLNEAADRLREEYSKRLESDGIR